MSQAKSSSSIYFGCFGVKSIANKTKLEISISQITVDSSLVIIDLPVPDTNWKNGFHLKQNCFYLRRLASPFWIHKHLKASKGSGILLLSKGKGLWEKTSTTFKMAALPQKKYYRQRAHANPMADHTLD